jgi:hypothetical protein
MFLSSHQSCSEAFPSWTRLSSHPGVIGESKPIDGAVRSGVAGAAIYISYS